MRRMAAYVLTIVAAVLMAVYADDPQPQWVKGQVPNTNVAQIESDLQRLRGLNFKTPVPVVIRHKADFHDQFAARLACNEDAVDREQSELLAWGYVDPGYDLKSVYADALAGSILAYYDPKSKAFYVDVDAHNEVPNWLAAEYKQLGLSDEAITTAHELDHALQDQYFNLTAFQQKMKKAPDSDTQLASRSLIEGEARWIEYAFQYDRAGIPAVSRRTFREIMQDQVGQRQIKTPADALPLVLRKSLSFPYIEGSDFVHTLRRLAPDWSLVNQAWTDPPDSTQQILHPFLYVGQRLFPTDIRFKTLEDSAGGWTKIDEDTQGEFGTYVLLDSLLGENDSEGHRKLATAWVGDRYRVYQKGDHNAVVWFSTWKDEDSCKAIAAALRQGWTSGARGQVPLRLEQHSKDLWIVRGVPAEEVATFFPQVGDVTRTVREHPVAIQLSDEEIAKREEAAAAIKPDAAKLAKFRASLPQPTPPPSDFVQIGTRWESRHLLLLINPPAVWTLRRDSTAGSPIALLGERLSSPPTRMLIEPLQGSEDLTVEDLGKLMNTLFEHEFPGVVMTGHRDYEFKGLHSTELDMNAPLKNGYQLRIQSLCVRHRGQAVMFVFVGGDAATVEEFMQAVQFQ
ncbi:MAG: hypothetical protein ACYCW6_11575 [Candidatus Xenobia bacterium]